MLQEHALLTKAAGVQLLAFRCDNNLPMTVGSSRIFNAVVRLSAIALIGAPHALQTLTSVPGRPRLRGPIEHSVEGFVFYALFFAFMPYEVQHSR